MNLGEHIDGSSIRNKTSGYIATTKVSDGGVIDEWIEGFEEGWLYKIKNPAEGIDINKHAPPNYGFSWEQEIVVPLTIPYKNIMGHEFLSTKPPDK